MRCNRRISLKRLVFSGVIDGINSGANKGSWRQWLNRLKEKFARNTAAQIELVERVKWFGFVW